MTDAERIAALEARLDKLESMLDPSTENLRISGNINMVGPREDGNPIKLFMGPDMDRGLYFFVDKRDPAEGTEYFAGFETYVKPDGPPAVGYGALPLRSWGMLGVDELNGVIVRRNIVAQAIYLQTPAHRNLQTGAFEKAHHYDTKGVPYTEAGEMMGGIYPDYSDLSVRLERVGDEVWLFAPGGDRRLA